MVNYGGVDRISRTSDLIFFNSGALPNILHYITLHMFTFHHFHAQLVLKHDWLASVWRKSSLFYVLLSSFERKMAFRLHFVCGSVRVRCMVVGQQKRLELVLVNQ